MIHYRPRGYYFILAAFKRRLHYLEIGKWVLFTASSRWVQCLTQIGTKQSVVESHLDFSVHPWDTCKEWSSLNACCWPATDFTHTFVIQTCLACVCPAAAGRLGSRCDWRYLRGCQQQVQTDGLWLCQVRVSRSEYLQKSEILYLFVCTLVFQRYIVVLVVCVQCENLSVCVCRGLPSVCLLKTQNGLCNLSGWQESVRLAGIPHLLLNLSLKVVWVLYLIDAHAVVFFFVIFALTRR